MKIVIMSHEDVTSLWATVSYYLKKAQEYGQGESTLTDYLRKILNDEAQCWAIIEDTKIVGVGLTEINHYAQHKTLHLIAYSGDSFEKQFKMFYAIEDFAKATGCKAIEQWGRQGWSKVLPKYVPGFKQAYVVMRKDLE